MVKEKKEINPFLKSLFPIVDCIANLIGKNCEVVLHDVSQPEHSIIKIRNGHVTGRKEGAALTDIALEMIKSADDGLEVLGTYNPRAKNGRLLKSNACNIKDPKGKLVGIMCINLDVSSIQQFDQSLRHFAQKLQDFTIVKDEREIKAKDEKFESDLWSIIREIIEEIIREKGKTVDFLTKDEREEVIKTLDEKGIFRVKGAIHLVANAMGISSPTIYRYLEKSRLETRNPIPFSIQGISKKK